MNILVGKNIRSIAAVTLVTLFSASLTQAASWDFKSKGFGWGADPSRPGYMKSRDNFKVKIVNDANYVMYTSNGLVLKSQNLKKGATAQIKGGGIANNTAFAGRNFKATCSIDAGGRNRSMGAIYLHHKRNVASYEVDILENRPTGARINYLTWTAGGESAADGFTKIGAPKSREYQLQFAGNTFTSTIGGKKRTKQILNTRELSNTMIIHNKAFRFTLNAPSDGAVAPMRCSKASN